MTFGEKRLHACERVTMRRWLRVRGFHPVAGCEDQHTHALAEQVRTAGGDPEALMRDGRDRAETVPAWVTW